MSGDLWVYGYGSLMWNPGFPFAEHHRARLTGFHRALCIYSMHYRGTPKAPGLVLGLDRGGACEGIAFRVTAENAARVLHYLRARELITGVYREALLPVTLLVGARTEVEATVFIAERRHPAYASDLPIAEAARIVRTARGTAGCNLDYVLSTACHLAELGIRERWLERLTGLLGPHLVRRCGCAFAHDGARTRALCRGASRRKVSVRASRVGLADRLRFGFRRRLTKR